MMRSACRGVALGADLALPGAMLTRVIQQAGLAGRAEGAFFGWWNGANKLNLALAAGLALPLLQALGYTPGQRDATGHQAPAAPLQPIHNRSHHAEPPR